MVIYNMQENNEEKEEPMLDVKFLLKQVYAAHMSKVKELQTEVTKLKEELKEAKEKILADCPKCKQMELAYSACKEEYKNAVLEQTLRLKELEQKFAAIDRKAESMSNKNNKDRCSDFGPLPQNHASDSMPESLKFTESEIQDEEMHDYESVKPLRYYTEIEKSIVEEKKIPLLHIEKSYSSEKNICNLMELSAESKLGHESFDNSLILVPETVDFVQNTLDTTGGRSPNKKSLSPRNKKSIGKENQNDEKDSSPIKAGMSPLKSSRKRAFSEQIINNELQNENEGKRFFRAITDIKDTVSVSVPPSTSIKNAKRKKFQKQKGCTENVLTEGMDCSPKKIALLDDKIKQTTFIDDDDDFQSRYLPCDEPAISSWKSKISSKKASLKTIKTTSRYKMTWEANNIAKKKINYKQTKLSASTFQSNKASSDSLDDTDVCILDNGAIFNEKSVETEKAKSNESSLVGLSELVSLVDADSTHASPSSHNQEVTVNKDNVNLHAQRNVVLSQIETLSQSIEDRKPVVVCSEVEDTFEERKKEDDNPDLNENCEELKVQNDKKKENKKNVNMTVINLLESFDRVPVASNEPLYKYKEDTVRNKEKRQNLQGFECKDCEKYYNELGLTENEKKDRMNYCSRHRAKHLPPSTPENYWELDFPDTGECKLRGYIGNTQKVELKQRRRRPLNKD